MLGFHDPFDEDHIREILKLWVAHYNKSRPHSSLGPGFPDSKVRKAELPIKRHCIPKGRRIVVKPILGGLHHEYGLEEIAA
jgi:putative transposase